MLERIQLIRNLIDNIAYGGKDSMDDDYKQKRVRNDRGGGGGSGGRTAIPYIKNRGDIYERDH
jgi:hypothetical protein